MPSSRKRNQRKNRPNRNLNFETLEPRRLLTVNGPGISDPALFGLVINVPADTTRDGFLEEIVGEVFSPPTVQINVAEGGIVGNSVEAFASSEFNISGGEIGVGFETGSEVNISGGEVGAGFRAESGSVVNISGGVVGEDFGAFFGSEVNISGGVVGEGFGAFSGSVVNIGGGEIGEGFEARAGSEVNLFVEEFEIDGVPQSVPETGETITITDRDIILSGRFTNNTTFSFDLNEVVPEEPEVFLLPRLANTSFERPLFSPDATLTVTLVGSVVQGVPSDVTVVENTASDLDLSTLSYSASSPFGFGRVQVGLEVSEGILAATSNNDVTVRGSGTGELTLTGLVENLNTFFDDASNVQYTGPAGLSGDDAVTLTLTLDDDSPTITNQINIDITPLEDGPNIVGSDGDDEIEATGEDGTLVGGTGSDILIGSTGNDVFTTDLINGDKDRNDQDVIRLGNVDGNDTGNDVITDFDVNRNNRSENNFDTLEFTFQGINHSLSSRNDILNFVAFIESDGDVNTDAIIDGDDLILIFGRDSENPDIITSSIRLVNVVGQNGLSFNRLRSNSVDELGEFQDDFFSAAGNVDIGSDVGETLEGSSENDNIIGGLGSDTLVGGGGNDTLTGDENLGDNNQFDQDIFVLGDVSAGGSGNDVITDFDTNNANGGEDNFDTLEVSIGDQQFALDTGNEFLTFANLLESDGNDGTGTLIDGDDLIFVFSRNADGVITDSVRLEDIIGDDGLTDAALAAFDRIGESDGIDIFV